MQWFKLSCAYKLFINSMYIHHMDKILSTRDKNVRKIMGFPCNMYICTVCPKCLQSSSYFHSTVYLELHLVKNKIIQKQNMTDNLHGGIINTYIYMYLRTYMFYRNKLPFFKIYFRNSMLVHGLEHKKAQTTTTTTTFYS